MWQGNGCIMYEILREFLGHNFVSGLLALKPKNLQTYKLFLRFFLVVVPAEIGSLGHTVRTTFWNVDALQEKTCQCNVNVNMRFIVSPLLKEHGCIT